MKHLLKSGALPGRTKEAIGLTMAALHRCEY
jgi:AhpD family alkylhydroperoxidase